MSDIVAQQVVGGDIPEDIQETVGDAFSALRSGIPESPEQTELREELETQDQPRDDKGRFVPKQGEELILGKFKSHDELESAYTALEAKLGEQGSELGSLRKLIEDRIPEQQYGTQITEEHVTWLDEQVDENPQGAALWAMQNDPSGALYNRVLDAWYEQAPRAASTFERQLEMAALVQHQQQAQQPLVEQFQQNEFAQAWQAVSDRVPAINSNVEAIIEVAQGNPDLLMSLQSGSREAKERTIENLHYLALGRQAGTLPEQQVATPESSEARAVKLAAATAVASSAGPGEKSESPAATLWGEAPPSISQGLTFGK